MSATLSQQLTALSQAAASIEREILALEEQNGALVEALERAKEFVRIGESFGYVDHPTSQEATWNVTVEELQAALDAVRSAELSRVAQAKADKENDPDLEGKVE